MNRLFRIFARVMTRLTAALLVLLPVATQAEDQGLVSAVREPAVRPALWKVSDEDTTIYLFGTIHVLPAGIDWFEGPVADAFNGSQELVTEIVETDAAANKGRLMARAALPHGQTLRAMMSAEDKASYETGLATLGMPVQAFDGYEPWLAAMVLSVAPLAKEGFSPANGVDEMLGIKAKAKGLPHGALETYEYQLGLFDSLPLDMQKIYLSQVVKDLPTVRADIDKMIAAWKSGDADALAKLMNADQDYPGMYEMLLTNRNKAWAGWIKQRLAKPGTVFVAVGAGHLAGPGSVQEQLIARGLSAERLQ